MAFGILTGGARWADVLATALAIGVPPALGWLGLVMLAAGPWADARSCSPEPCPRIGPILMLGGITVMIAAVIGLGASVWCIRRRGRVGFLVSAIRVLLVGLFAAVLMLGPQAGNALVEVGALIAASLVVPVAVDRPLLLRAALLAQATDLATFGFVWQEGAGERNPTGRWTIELLSALGTADASLSWAVAAAAGSALILAKLALIAYLVRITPHLRQYRRLVLLTAFGAGSVGALGNALTRLP